MRAPVIIAALVALSGCGKTIQKSALNTTADIMWKASMAMEQEPDLELARAATGPGIKQAEGMFIANPNNSKLRRLLARGYCGYASFVQDDWEVATTEKRFDDAEHLADRGSALFLRCVSYALMSLGDGWKQDLFGPEDAVKARLAKVGKGHATDLLWTAIGLGGAIQMMMGNMEAVAQLSKVELLLTRVIELDDGDDAAMAHAILGSVQCGRSVANGGEPDKGKANLEAATVLTGGKMLMAKVLLARHCAVNTADRELFRSALLDVLTTDPAVWPEQRLANEFARHKARRYLKHEKDFF